MALAIFDARPDRVQVGDLFDTNKRYIYRSDSGVIDSSNVKIATGPTIVGSGSNLTYSFDGAVYWVNTQLAISPSYAVLGMT